LAAEEAKAGRLSACLSVRHSELEHSSYSIDLADWRDPRDRWASREGEPRLKTPSLGEFHDQIREFVEPTFLSLTPDAGS
jgi:hypothetical protein